MNVEIKRSLIALCRNLLENRIETARLAMNNAQQAANEEGKSSAGDKYETSRAMGQLDRDMNAKQLLAAQIELDALDRIRADYPNLANGAGRLLETNHGNYFIAAAIGKVELEHTTFTVISTSSPLAKFFIGKKEGDEILFRDQKIKIIASV